MGGETRSRHWGASRTGALPEDNSGESGLRRILPRGRRVLLVEDEDMVRKVLLRMLAARGYDVKTAASVSEAEAVFAAPGNTFDLLITDVMIAQGSGHVLARSLVERCPSLRVLFVSGYSGGAAVKGLDPSQVRFLTKPFGATELTQMIHDLLPPPAPEP